MSNLFPDNIPNGWRVAKLDDVVEILDYLRKPVNREERATRPGPFPYYGATGQVGWIDDFIFDGEHILLGEDGAPFLDPSKPKAYVATGKFWVNNHAHVLTPKKGIALRFILHQLNCLDYRAFVSGTTRLKLPQSQMRSIPILIAPEEEQHRIADLIERQLTLLASGAENLRTVKAKLKRYRAAVLEAACKGQIVTRAPEKQGDKAIGRLSLRIGSTEALADSDLAPLPAGWRWMYLGQLLSKIEAGKSFKCEERPPRGEEVGVLKVSAVSWGHFNEHESKTCTQPDLIKPDFFIREGDFLFSRANTVQLVGACVLVGQTQKKLMLSDKILRLTFKSVSPKWLLYVLRSPFGRTEIERLATGNQESMRNIGQDRIRSIRIPVPPSEQIECVVQEIETRLSVADQLEKSLDLSLKRSKMLRQSVLKTAFEGSLVPQHLNCNTRQAHFELKPDQYD